MKIVDNLLQVGEDRLGAADEVANSSSRIVQSLGRQISNALAAGHNVSQVTRSLAVEARTFRSSDLAHGVGFAAILRENGTGSFDEDVVEIYWSGDEVPMADVLASIQLPAEVVNKSSQGKCHFKSWS